MAMLCPKCGKESNNLRVCAFCQTPYPTDGSALAPTPRFTRAVASPQASKATPSRTTATGDPRIGMARRSRAKRWGAIGLLAAFTGAFYFASRDRVIPVGVAIPNLIVAPMSTFEANGLLKMVEGTGQVEERGGELTVKIATAIFPERRDGQLALAQQYARAVEIVQGRKRAISFLDPSGNRFAKADPEKGVVMTR
jgi:hypothetical protein